MFYRILIGAGLLWLGYYVGRELQRTEPIRQKLDEFPDAQAPEAKPSGATEELTHLSVPEGAEWPVEGRSEDGQLILTPGFIAAVEEVSGLKRDTLTEDGVLPLLVKWYLARRKAGYPADEVMDELLMKAFGG